MMINNTSAVVTPLMRLLTNSVDSLLTLFNIDGVHDLLASLLGDLASVFLGVLVALLLLLVFTVRTTRVSVVTRISGTLVVITSIVFMMSINNFRLSFNNVRVVVDLFMLLITMCDDNILTLLNIGYIYNNIIVNITFFMFLLLGFLVALMILLVMTMRTIMISMAKVMSTRISSTIGNSCKSCRQEEN